MRMVIVWSIVFLIALGGGIYYLVGGDSEEEQAKVAKVEERQEARKARLTQQRRPAAGAVLTRKAVSAFGLAPEKFFEDGELLVADPPRTFIDTVGQLGFSVIERISLDGLGVVLYRLRVPTGTSVPAAQKILLGRFPGLTLDAHHHFEAQAMPEFPDQLARAVIGWSKAKPSCGRGIVLGMIDAPVDMTHDALKGQKVEFKPFRKKGRKLGPADHGTAVASIMVGRPEWGGLLPGATLKAGSMFEVNETGKVVGSAVGLIKSMNWLAKEKVPVVNLSVAGTDNKVVRKIVNKAVAKGMVMVAAAGNWGATGKAAYPAAYPDVIAVTAISGKKTIYSHANRGRYVEFAAPGVRLWTAVPGGGKFQSGTSFAAPFISVLTALELAGQAKPSARTLRTRLRGEAVDLGDPGRDEVFGWGFIGAEPACN